MAPKIPIPDALFKRDMVTMSQIDDFKNAATNGLRPDRRQFSDRFRELLDGRRRRPMARDVEKILAS